MALEKQLNCNTCSYDGTTVNHVGHTSDGDCPRIWLLPVILYNEDEFMGKSHVKIIGFARYFVSNVDAHAKGDQIKGYFLDDVHTTGGSDGSVTPHFGSYSTSLVE